MIDKNITCERVLLKSSFFTQDTFDFLSALVKNNNKIWFQKNRERYEDLVRTPALNFISAMSLELAGLSPHFLAVPKKVGGSLMRVHRDTRFSKDKTPYKTNVGIQFRHELGKDVHAPGYYVHIHPGDCFIGVGIWHPDGTTLKIIREHISNRSNEWATILKDKRFLQHFQLSGESLKNPPRGFTKDHPLINDIKRKDFIAVKPIPDAVVSSFELLTSVVSGFKTVSPFMRFLCEAIGIQF